jgi:hypothetical protein
LELLPLCATQPSPISSPILNPPAPRNPRVFLRPLSQELLAGLKRGVASLAGWLAASDLLLEQHEEQAQQRKREGVKDPAGLHTAQAAVDAAKEGLRAVAHRCGQAGGWRGGREGREGRAERNGGGSRSDEGGGALI